MSKQGFTLALQRLKYTGKKEELFLILLSNSRACALSGLDSAVPEFGVQVRYENTLVVLVHLYRGGLLL